MPRTFQNNVWLLKIFIGREAFDPVCNFGISDKLHFFGKNRLYYGVKNILPFSKLIIGKSQVGVIASMWGGGIYAPSLPPASPNRVNDGPHTDRMHLHITCHFVCSSHHMKSWLMSFSRKATNVDGLRAQEKALPAPQRSTLPIGLGSTSPQVPSLLQSFNCKYY